MKLIGKTCFNAKTNCRAARSRVARHGPSALPIALAAAFFAVPLCECLFADSAPMPPVRDLSSPANGSDDASADSLASTVISVVPAGERELDAGHLLTAGQHRLLPAPPPLSPSPEAVRLVRIDVAATLPRAVFALSAPSPARVWLDFNGVPLAAFDASPTPAPFAADLPSNLLVPHLPQRCRFHAESDAPFVLSDFHLEAPPPGSPAAIPPPSPLPDLPWLATSAELPSGASPLDVRYPDGVSLCGVSLLSSRPLPAHASDILPPVYPVRLYFRFSEPDDAPPDLLLVPGYARNGDRVASSRPVSLRAAVDTNAFPFSRGRLVAADIDLPLLPSLASGETFGLALDLQTATGRPLDGRAPDGSIIRRLFLPVSVVVP